MSKTSFTPGPWKATCRHIDYKEGYWDHDEFLQWEVEGPEPVTHGRGDFYFEDAHLIAASPEMYEAGDEALAALYGAREVLGDVANISHAINMLESAARKARGEN